MLAEPCKTILHNTANIGKDKSWGFKPTQLKNVLIKIYGEKNLAKESSNAAEKAADAMTLRLRIYSPVEGTTALPHSRAPSKHALIGLNFNTCAPS